MKNICFTLVCTLFTAALYASGTPTNGPKNAPLTFENCPTAPVEFCDFTPNDNSWVGDTSANPFSGNIMTEEAEPIKGVFVGLEATSNGAPIFQSSLTDALGNYEISLPMPIGGNFTITPELDVNPANGVNVLDLILISRHILGIEPLNNPYKIIAADANKSSSITAFDIVQFQKLILGVYNDLPNNTSWRFVDKGQVFSDPYNPFLDVIKENISNLPATTGPYDFIGVKIGDVNSSAQTQQFQEIDDRSADTLSFVVLDRAFQANEVFTVGFEPSLQQLGSQFTLNFEGLVLVDVIPGTGMSDINFGIFPDALTILSYNVPGSFALRFRATEAGVLSQKLSLDGSITPAEAYNLQDEQIPVDLRFDQMVSTQAGILAIRPVQNTPNPFSAATTITFELPTASEVQLSVYDALGRLVFEQKADYAKGAQQIQLDAGQLGAVKGALFYELRAEGGVARGQMMRF